MSFLLYMTCPLNIRSIFYENYYLDKYFIYHDYFVISINLFYWQHIYEHCNKRQKKCNLNKSRTTTETYFVYYKVVINKTIIYLDLFCQLK